MKKLLSLILIISSTITFINGYAQANDNGPVKWKTSVKKVAENEYELTATADIDENWNLYGNKTDDSSVATTFYFDTNKEYKKEGDVKEKGKENAYKGKIKVFKTKASFTQKIKVTSNVKNIKVTGTVEYMACSKSTCLPPKESTLAFNVKKG